MMVVSDTSPLTALITVGRAEILSALFGDVYIPTAVHVELMRGHSELPVFLRVGAVRHRERVERLLEALDEGGAEAIILAQELRADLLLMDERAGRKVAAREGVPVIGLMGVLLAAKRKRLIPSVRTVADQLRERASFRIGESVLHAVLREAGEL